MGRIREPQNARSRRTREAVLTAAWRIIETEGATAATMDRIAEEAGTSRRALYLHFASRTDLLLALRDHTDRELGLESSLRPLLEARTPGIRIDAFAAHVAGYHSRIAPLARAIDVARRAEPDVEVMWQATMERWLQGCRLLAGELHEVGLLAEPWTVETATDLLWALMSVDLVEDLVDDRGWTTAATAERLSLLIRRTLLTDPDVA